ncbi:MAG: hypothetical protein HYU86_06215 [Chloroflexi bacterium]|nr:hypothetical protein [Chloroflexota bacterium]
MAPAEALEMPDALDYIMHAFRRRETPVTVKIKGVRSSATVERELRRTLVERLRSFLPKERLDRFCETVKVELHAVERDGNWYDVFARRYD